MVAMARVDRRFLASLSYRVATRRKSLRRQKTASTIQRNLYRSLSKRMGFLRDFLRGMTGFAPFSLILARNLSLS